MRIGGGGDLDTAFWWVVSRSNTAWACGLEARGGRWVVYHWICHDTLSIQGRPAATSYILVRFDVATSMSCVPRFPSGLPILLTISSSLLSHLISLIPLITPRQPHSSRAPWLLTPLRLPHFLRPPHPHNQSITLNPTHPRPPRTSAAPS